MTRFQVIMAASLQTLAQRHIAGWRLAHGHARHLRFVGEQGEQWASSPTATLPYAAKGHTPQTLVRDVMTQLHTCLVSSTLDEVLPAMGDAQVRRLTVLDGWGFGSKCGRRAAGDFAAQLICAETAAPSGTMGHEQRLCTHSWS